MVTPIVVGLTWKSLYQLDNGLINLLLKEFHLPVIPWLTVEPIAWIQTIPYVGNWLTNYGNLNYGFVALVLIDVWQWTPFVFLILLSALHSLPSEPFEAAVIDGASKWQIFRYITFPMLEPVLIITLLLRVMEVMKVYDTIFALFGNSIYTRTLNVYIYTVGISLRNYGSGAALSILSLIVITIFSTFFVNRLYRKNKGEVVA